MRRARHLSDRLVRKTDQGLVEQDRLDAPDRVPLDVDPFIGGEAHRGILRGGEHAGKRRFVQMALVEELLGRLDDRGDDSRLADDVARGTDRAAPRLASDRADLQREPGRPCERVAALVHGRRAGMSRLAAPGDPGALDPERAEHDPERQSQRLEHRPLLDVKLEVGARALQLRARLGCAVEIDAVLAERVREGNPVPVLSFRSSSWSRIDPAAAEEPKRERPKRAPSSSAQLTRRTGTGGLPSSAIRRSTSEPATTLRAPSSQPPFGTESRWPPITSACSLP